MPVDAQTPGLRIVTADDDTILKSEFLQGLWTEQQYLRLTDHSRRLLEFADGSIEVLLMPTDKHQVISRFLFLALSLSDPAAWRHRALCSVAPADPRWEIP